MASRNARLGFVFFFGVEVHVSTDFARRVTLRDPYELVRPNGCIIFPDNGVVQFCTVVMQRVICCT